MDSRQNACPRVDDLHAAVASGDFDAVLLLQQHKQLDLELLQSGSVPVFDTCAVLSSRTPSNDYDLP